MTLASLTAPPVPCGSCPYRRDVPSGIWAKHEYDKLPPYDGPTWLQPPAIFMCHQRDGKICAGWLACHDPQELLALRFPREGGIDPAVFTYASPVPVFSSGEEARAHGMRDYKKPGERALKITAGLRRKRLAERKAQFPKFYVQGETVRGEPRYYWVSDRAGNSVTEPTTDKRKAERQCRKLLGSEPAKRRKRRA